jgi:hypothetical protein
MPSLRRRKLLWLIQRWSQTTHGSGRQTKEGCWWECGEEPGKLPIALRRVEQTSLS